MYSNSDALQKKLTFTVKMEGRNIEQWLGNSDSISLALEFPDTDDHEIDVLLASEFGDVGLGSAPNDKMSPSHNPPSLSQRLLLRFPFLGHSSQQLA